VTERTVDDVFVRDGNTFNARNRRSRRSVVWRYKAISSGTGAGKRGVEVLGA
jgi:hypothetical protein